jgi:undecaprenyl-diphosphatase
MNSFLELDHQLFRLINSTWTTPFLDAFLPSITDLHKTSGFVFIFIPLLIAVLLWKRKLEGLWIFFGSLLCLGLADLLGGKVIKPFFGRPRPPLVLEDVLIKAPHFGGFSFPSNHAVNMFCAAIFFGFYFPKFRPVLLIFAALVAYSRVYCGVHFPSDVLAGALLGAILGACAAKMWFHLYYQVIHKKRLI